MYNMYSHTPQTLCTINLLFSSQVAVTSGRAACTRAIVKATHLVPSSQETAALPVATMGKLVLRETIDTEVLGAAMVAK